MHPVSIYTEPDLENRLSRQMSKPLDTIPLRDPVAARGDGRTCCPRKALLQVEISAHDAGNEGGGMTALTRARLALPAPMAEAGIQNL